MRATRLAVVGLGIVAVAWFVLGARQAHEISLANDIVTQSAPVTAAQAARASSLLDSASTLNPDQQVQLLRAAVAVTRGHRSRAIQILESAARAEPLNLEVWYLLAQIAGNDKKVEAQALGQIAFLVPPVHSS